ncbi:MAG: sugar nucleotide-binding protein [candidate division Zixibacteria bacterium]|nr:sugar nucleotide-binding protein [candidate division Zixibacteria bacterium]
MNITPYTRIFITGCGGMLGKAVYEKFSAHCQVKATDIDINENWLEYADVRNYHATLKMAAEYSPDLIINLAALTDLEYCEKNPEESWKTNALGAENMAMISKKLKVPHVYISTAGIFDGEQEYYNDFDEPNPLSIYAKSKYYGEKYIHSKLERFFIFRAGWMMGGGIKKDKKFVNKIFKQIQAGNRTLYVVDDKLGTPTYTVNFADCMYQIVQTDLYGLYNMVCGGSCSRYDVAEEFVKLLGLENEIKIEIVDSGYFKTEYFAPRPASEKLVNLKLESRGINYMRDWRECLRDYAPLFKMALRTAAPREMVKEEAVTT